VTGEVSETLDAGTSVPATSAESQVEEAAVTPKLTPEAGDLEMLPEAEAVVRLAREDLAGRLGLAPEAIELVSIEVVEWSDTSLGCPQPGMMYAQVITPGFRVVLETEGEKYAYHTDREGQVTLCKPEMDGEIPSPKGIKDNTPWQPVEPIEPDRITPRPKK